MRSLLQAVYRTGRTSSVQSGTPLPRPARFTTAGAPGDAMRQTALEFVTLVAFAATGCGYFRSPPAPAAGPPTQEFSAHGISYELPLPADPEAPLAAARARLKLITANGIKWTDGAHTLEVIDDAVTWDGSAYGTLRKQDRVRLTADGVLTVNGQRRRRAADD